MPLWPTGRNWADMEAVSLKNYSIAELEKLVDAYPWYAAARRELFLKMSAMGEEYRRDALHHVSLYLYPDYSVFREGYVLSSAASADEDFNAEEPVCELDFSEISSGPSSEEPVPEYSPEAEVEIETPAAERTERKVYVVGGDYFMPEDLRDVQGQDLSSLDTSGKAMRIEDSADFTDEAFYTETLARIYADQELYDRANEVYEKLILLYPEKSAYFAALKSDIKKHL